MPDIYRNETLSRIAEVLTTNLGTVGRYLLDQQLKECGKTEESFTEDDIDPLIRGIKNEFARVIGYGVEKLELDLRKSIRELGRVR